MKVMLHGFGSFPVVFYHVITYAKIAYPTVEWSIILTTDHYASLFERLLGSENVYVYSASDKDGSQERGEQAAEYCGPLFQDIEAEKVTLKHQDSEYQINYAVGIYHAARRFMWRIKPDVALVSQVEGFDGKAFIAAARSVNAMVAVPTGCRNIGGIYFSPDDLETFPRYADMDRVHSRRDAAAFIEYFRLSPADARVDVGIADDKLLPNFQPPLHVRALRSIRRWLTDPQNIEPIFVRVAVQNNLPWLRDAIWAARTRVNQKYCHIASLDELPTKFIYFPLQYSPESSINTPAAFFVDQLRAIDAIRFAMPNNYRLVVKEHPACIKIRSSALIKSVMTRSGVNVVDHRIPSIDLVKKAAITVSVTGTATLEAFLLGRNAITLGGSLPASLLGGTCPIHELPQHIRAMLQLDPTDGSQDNDTVNALAELLAVRHKCNFGAPGSVGEPVLRAMNLKAFTDAFMVHCNKTLNDQVDRNMVKNEFNS